MAEEPSYILDLHQIPEESSGGLEGSVLDSAVTDDLESKGMGRPWIGVHFECCGVYTRIYRNRQATAYEGHCPRCQRVARIRIGPGGSNHRIFRAM